MIMPPGWPCARRNGRGGGEIVQLLRGGKFARKREVEIICRGVSAPKSARRSQIAGIAIAASRLRSANLVRTDMDSSQEGTENPTRTVAVATITAVGVITLAWAAFLCWLALKAWSLVSTLRLYPP